MTDPDSDVIEKVARAICLDGGFNPDERMPNDGPRWKYYETLAQAAIAALKAGGWAKQKWRPIEEAPKGVKLLCGYYNEAGRWRTITARYYDRKTLDWNSDYGECEDEDGYAPEGWYEESETHESILPAPFVTHFMPLPPAPPSTQDGE